MVFTPTVASTLKARGFLYSELAKFARAGFGIDKACESILGQSGSDRTAREICRDNPHRSAFWKNACRVPQR
jgi:hypothetical protein